MTPFYCGEFTWSLRYPSWYNRYLYNTAPFYYGEFIWSFRYPTYHNRYLYVMTLPYHGEFTWSIRYSTSYNCSLLYYDTSLLRTVWLFSCNPIGQLCLSCPGDSSRTVMGLEMKRPSCPCLYWVYYLLDWENVLWWEGVRTIQHTQTLFTWKSTCYKYRLPSNSEANQGRSRGAVDVSVSILTRTLDSSELTQEDGRGKKTANLVWQTWQ